jgi:hypothetical protein
LNTLLLLAEVEEAVLVLEILRLVLVVLVV